MTKSLLFIIALTCSFHLFSQLITTTNTENTSGFFDTTTNVYFETDVFSVSRDLMPNEAYLNTPLGNRENETPLTCSSFTLGISLPLNTVLKLNTGLCFLQNGESYNWQSTENDSTFNYTSRYGYIALPISLSTAYGKKLKFHISAGITPGIFNNYKKQTNWTDPDGSEYDEETKIQNDLNSFNLSAQGSIGMAYYFKSFSIRASYALRKQLNNTYKAYQDYIHRSIGMGGRLTLTYFL